MTAVDSTISIADTPNAVKDSIKKAANFVKDNIFGLGYQPWNAFFSGSVKGNSVS